MRYAAPWIVLVSIALALGFVWGRQSGLAEGEVVLELRPGDGVAMSAEERPASARSVVATTPRIERSPPVHIAPTTIARYRPPVPTDAMARAPAAPAPLDASGVLEGRVTWTDGSPLPGAIVVTEPDDPWSLAVTRDRPIDGTLYRPDPALSHVNVQRQSNWLALNRLETATDADGRFRFEGLDARREHWVSAYAAGAEIDGSGGRYTQSVCGNDVSLTAVPVAAIAFILRLSDGSEPDAAVIDDRPAGGSQEGCKRNWFRDFPAVTLRKGQRSVCVWTKIGADEYVSPAITVDVTDSIDPIEVRLELQLAVTGRVVAPAGERLSGQSVLIMRYADSGAPDDDRMRADAEAVAIKKSTGAFEKRPVAPGRYALMVVDLFGTTRRRAVVDVVDRSVDIEIVLPPVPASMYIRIKVLANDGSQVTDATVRDRDSSIEAVRQTDGSFVLSKPQLFEAMMYTEGESQRFLLVGSARLGTTVVEYAPETDQEVVVRYETPGYLRLELVGRGADDGGTCHCRLYGSRHSESLDPTDQGSSEYVTGGIQPDDYRIYVMRRIGDFSHEFSVPIRIGPGQNYRAVSLPEILTLTVDLSELTGVTRVLIDRNIDKGDSIKCWVADLGASGSLRTYSGLIAGRYTARAADADGETVSLEFEVVGNTTIRLRKGKADSARIIDPGAALAQHGIVSGDIVYGFGEFEWNANPGRAIEACSSFQGSLELRVRRNGRDLRIPVAASAVSSARWSPCIR